MNLDRLVARLAEEISGARAKRIAEEISQFHRIQGSPGYNEAIDHVSAALAAVGVESKVHEYPADGRSKTYEWTAPPAWSVRSGSLWQTEPKERALASFDEILQSVVVHSPGGAVEGELIHVGNGTADEDYKGADVGAKLVLVCGRASEVEKQAGPRGAAGIVIYPDSERAAADHDLVQYQGIFPRAEAIEALVPAFSISRRAADRLLKSLDHGPVKLRGEIDAEFIDGHLRVLEALVRGEDADAGEVVLVAHICHPRQSANDNASGSGLLVELARTLQGLREEVGLRHTVRFVWVPEFYGTLPWAVAHTEELKRAHFVLNLDMVGQSPDVIGEPLRVSRVPNAIPSYLNACIAPIATRVATLAAVAPGGSLRTFHWSFDVPCGGSDHLVFGASPHRLPAVMLHHDDPFWHTSLDTVDKVDPSRLKQVGILSATLAMLPSVHEEGPCFLQEWLLGFGVDAMTRASALARQLGPRDGRRLLGLALRIEEERVDDLVRAFSEDLDAPSVDRHKAALRAAFDHVAGLLPDADGASAGDSAERTPKRIVDGPLVYVVTERLDEEELAFFKETLSAEHRAVAESLLGLCDGTRTVEEIALQLSLDFDRAIPAEDVERGIDLLVKVGYAEG